ncbi:MAG: hypothetical protein Q8R22_04320 [Flavobacterium sp.]|uniref:hypothetical protein n=1 Tax=Flavobacterium sp. TaxID=239 RepID=UPI002733AF6A|nr:hypothetical protein [Flavobacterium sp.]MDP3680037.1 hypothetical protein [Flavobacterium sp.]
MTDTLDKLKDSFNSSYDVFIASASYEERCLSIIKNIETEISFGYKIVSLSTPHKELISDNLNIFIEKDFTVVEVDNSDQVGTMMSLLSPIIDILEDNEDASFLVDITTFTRQTLLILLRLLRNILTTKNLVQFVYAPAKEYSIGLKHCDKWLTRGILEVNSVFGYSGVIRPSRPYHLIILLGFEVERASSLIDAYEPTKISIGYAKKLDSLSPEDYELNKEKCKELLLEYPIAEYFEFSCVHVEECKTEILDQVRKHGKSNVIISPMNNKISTVACALAAFENEEIQLAIAIPATYNHENYSSSGTSFHILEVTDFIK